MLGVDTHKRRPKEAGMPHMDLRAEKTQPSPRHGIASDEENRETSNEGNDGNAERWTMET